MRLGLAAIWLVTAFRLVLAARLGLAADEAYYWCWSEELAFSYFDHPPGIAWLIRLGTTLLGDTELGVRAGGLVLQAVALSALLWHERSKHTLLLLFAVPGVLLPAVLATPDVGLLAFWILSIVAADRGRWVLAGVLAAAAVWFKLSGVLLVAALVLAAPRDRRAWGSAALAMALAAPSFAGHVLFQLDHGLARGDGGAIPLIEFLGAQIGLLGLLVPIAAGFWLVRGPRDRWWWSAVLTVVLFGGASLISRGEGNWGLPFVVAAVVGASRTQGIAQRFALWGGSIGFILSAVVFVHAWTPVLPLPKDPTDELHLGRFVGESVGAWGVEPVLSERYQEAAWVRFYGEVEATTLPGAGRESQFDLWREELPEASVVVRPSRSGDVWPTDGLYGERGGARDIVARRGERVIGTWQVAEVEGYDGGL